MARITLTDAAIRHLVADPKLREWQNEKSGSNVPILGYFQRSYSTAKDGTITEYGDGFMLTFDDPALDWERQGLLDTMVPVASGLDVLVVGPKSIFSTDVTIDWAKGTYKFEPQRPA